ncbi:MAG: DNRLRE domain-containing protein [Thermodesulfobacteriota bacterium]|nr:MAG: DNRLRE domain-containing protein [Thermodesulfobacteriota bacterium]
MDAWGVAANNGCRAAEPHNYTSPTRYRIYRGFLQFDLSGIPDNAIITTAELWVYYGGANPQNCSLYYVPSDSAVTNTMSWNSQPAPSGAALDEQFLDMNNRWTTFNILAVPNVWNFASDLSDNLLSLLIKGCESSGGPYILSQFSTLEALPGTDLDPYLVIEYTVRPVPIPAALWLVGSGLIGLFGFRRKFRK